MMRSCFLIQFLFSFSLVFTQTNSIIPAPVSYKSNPGVFLFDNTTYITANNITAFKEANAAKLFFINYYQLPLKTLTSSTGNGKEILVQYDNTLQIPDEGYQLVVAENKITITAKNKGGVFYGLMSLLQMITQNSEGNYEVTCCEITDYPRFAYRGMHLDCARHFFDVDFIKKYIDYLALYKYNTFHWHLTDDQGWRIEIKQYPKLTEVGAWRDGTMVGHYREQKFDSFRYGGFYTQAEIKQIVKYAAERNITIIPEIEMPGHCLAALAAYPELGCVDDTTYSVGKAWGVYPDVFCPKEETFTFLENVLDEVMELFPSEYIHIGVDEVEKTKWKNSAFCESLMLEKNLKDEHELQSYFIQRIEKYVNSKGKKIIGWDEILEGGLAPNATIMSWRGEAGGIAAAQQNHYAIMTPGNYCYFDKYQGSPANEPLAIGGFTPIEKVYSYEPIPAQLTAEQAKYILGAQANVWTEYITSPEQVEYMVMPRMLALSEVLWSSKEKKNYDDFVQRLLVHFKLLEKVNCNYAKTLYKIRARILEGDNYSGVKLELTSNFPESIISSKIYYPNSTTFYNKYAVPIPLKRSVTVESYLEGTNPKIPVVTFLDFTKATGKKITLTTPPSNKYPADGAFTLVNGIVATTKPNWAANEWLGFEGTDCEAIIDLGKTDTISKITVGYLDDKLSWIWVPASVTLETSIDGENYSSPVEYTINVNDEKSKRNFSINLNQVSTRYVKIKIKNFGTIPPGNPGAGSKAWLFVDEISIE